MVRDFAEVPRDAERVVFYPGRGRVSVHRVERRARELLRTTLAEEVRRLRAARVLQRPGSRRPRQRLRLPRLSAPALVAYETLTGRLLSEYCVRFRDDGVRLPDADDVLAKWLALHGRERELIATANVNPPGHQVDPDHVRRDLALLARWRSERAVDSRAIDEPQRRQGWTLPRPRSAAVFDGPDRAAARRT